MRKRNSSDIAREIAQLHVAESRFGIWFISSETWATHVLRPAIDDMKRLIKNDKVSYPVIVDVGCGSGRSFKMLRDRFAPQHLIGVDIDPKMLSLSEVEAAKHGIAVQLKRSALSDLPLGDATVDMVFCHQTFHHLVDQEKSICEFHRVLKPGGVLLFAESTRAYIHSWIIRLLFRHPLEVQKSAAEYLTMIRNAGFDVASDAISYPYLWWSRPDLGLMEQLGRMPAQTREETLLNIVAVRR